MTLQHAILLLGLLLPLSLDTFVLSAALGFVGLPKKRQLQTSLTLALFEALMPLVGLLIGASIGHIIGHLADYVAIGVIGLLGLIMLKPGEEKAREKEEKLLSRTRGIAVVGMGIGISLDELAMGLGLGLLEVPVVAIVIYLGVQAFVASQAGLWLGSSLSERFRSLAEKLAGSILLSAGVVLLVLKVTGHQT